MPNDIYVEVPTSTSEVSVSWTIPSASSCCSACNDPASCVTIRQTGGPDSGSNFYRQSRTLITYEAQDACGNMATCEFYVLVDIDEGTGRISNNDAADALQLGSIETEETTIASDAETTEQLAIEVVQAPSTKKINAPVASIIYPNPVTDLITIEVAEGRALTSMRMISSQGQLIQRGFIPQLATTSYDLSALNKGLYFMELHYADGSSEIKRVIKL